MLARFFAERVESAFTGELPPESDQCLDELVD